MRSVISVVRDLSGMCYPEKRFGLCVLCELGGDLISGSASVHLMLDEI